MLPYYSFVHPEKRLILAEEERNSKIKIKRENVGLYMAPFLADMRFGCIAIAIPLLAISFDASPLTLGMLGFTSGLTYISLCVLFGKLSERWQRKNVVIVGCAVFIAASLLLSFSSRIYQIYLSMSLLGIANAMFWPAMEAWIAEKQSKRSLVQRMALFNISWSAGSTPGPLIGGLLYEVNSKLPFYFAFITSIFILFILLWKTPKLNLVTENKTLSDKTLSLKDPPRNFSLYIAISRIANFTLWLSMGVIRYVFPKLGTQLGISPMFLGLLMLTLCLSQTLTFYVLGAIRQWHYRMVPLVFFQLLAIIGLVVFFMISSLPLFFLAFVFMGVGIGMTYSSSLFYSLNIAYRRGPSAAIHETVLGAGNLLGSLMGGIVAQKFSLRAPYLVLATVVLGGILIQVLIRRYYGSLDRSSTPCRP